VVDVKTLYVSDLDGTLLNSEDCLSAYTIDTINRLTHSGMCFSYATARSHSSASIVTKGLTTDIPVIVYNGAFILNANTGDVLSSLYFSQSEKESVAYILNDSSIFPLVYSYVDGKERVSWLSGKENDGMNRYLDLRKGDRRLRCVSNPASLYDGNAFYFTCIGTREELLNIYEQFRNLEGYTCILQQELYREEYWCEIMPRKATKGNAINQLKNLLQCDKVISFGDAINDIPMFLISDESYAVGNAVNELKDIATMVIGSNDEDGVAHWLEKNFLAE